MYVFDTNSLIKLNGFSKDVFVSLWDEIATLVEDGDLTSTREVLREVADRDDEVHLWCKSNKDLFVTPDDSEVAIVGEIMSMSKFVAHMPKQTFLSSRPFADPYVIARAECLNWTVVSEEKEKKSSAKIPNICQHFGVQCVNLDDFMKSQGWQF
ncbi:uncharacterized protein DUF4411 [Litoreibacter meonggei]|uniref:Uncharacterized protein DUF4411 n=1 Tax=Litoreibacter meonggei TaxID=1049199 RepID=A0A497X202_9RHOB|nr:DUF4411 family protein [Litoreibacter meonggei]RLJ59416.1 uncharacterized protein DUF4411 [Litoreibacter meonggei]